MIHLRRAADPDRAPIAAIHAQSWRDAYRGVLPDALLDGEIDSIMSRRWEGQAIRPEDAVLVAEQDGGLVGFCAAWDGQSAYIDNLHVLRDARSRGIGRRLLAETARHFLGRGRNQAHLHVVATNVRARSLYQGLGGVPAGIEDKNLYGTLVPNERIEWRDLALLLERAETG
ncbi:MAG: histone acetyltransferase and related acetyltransferase [Alphaproteobacteria bacterium]|nr:histone acetyltransferase and related acetyltransferase [Alphaproteobacteria bacterium]